MAKRQRTAGTHAAPSTQLTDGWGLLRPSAQARIQTIAGMSDCSIRIGTTVFGSLHRLKLAEASAVLRGMIESVADSSTIVLHDDTPEQVALAIALIYEPFMGSLTDDTVGDALTLSIKYDLADVLEAAKAHVMRAELTVDNFPHWLPLAAAHELQPAVDRCLAFARTGDNLHDIMERYEDTWMQRLPAAVLTQLLAPQLRLESAARRAMVDSLNWSMGTAVKPLYAAQWPLDAESFCYNAETDAGGPVDHTTVRVVLETVRLKAAAMLRDNPEAGFGPSLQRLLPAACEAIGGVATADGR